MSPLERRVLRLFGLWAVLAGVELLERVAYRAGALDVAAAVVDEDLADDELEPADVSDVYAAHVSCCLVVVELDAEPAA